MTSPFTAKENKATATGRVSLQFLRDMKKRHEPVAMLTTYDFPTAKILAESGIEILLVGDSAATTVLGLESTVGATMDFMVMLTGAVVRGADSGANAGGPGTGLRPFVMGDMPFASYPDIATAVSNAARFIKEAGADGIKLEADIRHREMVTALSAAGIVTCAHVGLLPQRAAQQGGYVAQGRTQAEARRIIEEAVQLAQAGAHMLLIEAVPDEVTAEVIRQLNAAGLEVPVLGCGAGASADGHVVVIYDMLGYSSRVPRFVERYGDLPASIREATHHYVEAIKGRKYPAAQHQYRMKAAD